jgi:hypothetical protein
MSLTLIATRSMPRVVATEREREHELGPHAVGARHEHRVLNRSPIRLAPPNPLTREHLGAHRPSGSGLDALTERTPASMSTPASRWREIGAKVE